MANSTRSKLFLDGRDLSPDIQRISWPRMVETRETSSISSVSKEFVATLKDGGDADLEMLWDSGTLRSSFLAGELGTIQQAIYGPNLDTLGEEAQIVNDALLSIYGRSHGRGDLVAASGILRFSQDVNTGLFLMPSAPITSDGGQPEHDNGASSSDGLTAWMQVLDITDMDEVDVIIEMDDNDGFASAATSITFATITDGSEPTTVEGTDTGTIERYLRVVPTFGNPGGSPSLAIVVAVLRG